MVLFLEYFFQQLFMNMDLIYQRNNNFFLFKLYSAMHQLIYFKESQSILKFMSYAGTTIYFINFYFQCTARCAGSDGSMSASGSLGPGFDPRRGSKFSFENFQPRC